MSLTRRLLLCLALPGAASALAREPGADWTALPPAQSGWPADAITGIEAEARGIGSTALVVVQHGAIVAQWGDTSTNLLLNSARKSLASALIGIAVSEGGINLDSTMGQLGIDDIPPGLSAAEKQATVRDLLMARSGIYHPANYETRTMQKRRPARGSHAPGSYWFYNNWDFNVLGTILEKAVGQPIFTAFQQQIAHPIGMQDFDPAQCHYVEGPASRFPAYIFHASARDLARFGQLYLQNGQWGGKQIIPAAWVHDSIQPYSFTHRETGYGFLWWTAFPDRGVPSLNLPAGSYFAWGNRGQFVFVIPSRDMVVVNLARRTRTNEDGVSLPQMAKLLGRILAAAP